MPTRCDARTAYIMHSDDLIAIHKEVENTT